MKRFSFLILLFSLSTFFMFSEKVYLTDNWLYNLDHSLDKWKSFDLKSSLEQQQIYLNKGNVIYYQYSFSKDKIQHLLNSDNDIGIYLGKVEGITDVYFNDKKVFTALLNTKIIFFEIDSELIKSRNIVKLKVTKSVSGFTAKFNNSSPYIDFYDDIMLHYYFMYLVLVIIGCCTFLIGLFFLMFFHLKLNNFQYIIYFIMCFFSATYTFLKSPLKFYLIEKHGVSWLFLEKIVFITLYSLPFIGLLFLLTIFSTDKKLFRVISISHGGISIVFFSIALFLNFDFMTLSLPYFHVFTFLTIVVYFFLTIRQIFRRDRYISNIFAGLVVLSLFILLDMAGVLHLFEYWDKFPFFSIGYFLFVFMIGLYLSRQFLKVNLDLRSMNINLEQKVIDRTAELNSTLNFKSNLLTTTAHHTRTPLTLIKNGFDTLFNIYPEFEKNKQLKMIKRNVDLMTRDIVNIFDMAQLEQGKRLYANAKTFSLSKMLKDKVNLFSDSARINGIHIKEVIDGDIFVKADDLALNRVIDNLLDNGIKYCESGSVISVGLKADNSRMVLTVADDGPGIDKEELFHIFERYYQIERDKQVSSGLGLGLALTKEIIDELGGTIEVESEPGRGTTFSVELERAFATKQEDYRLTSPIESVPITVEESCRHKKGKNIMVVEDEPELLLYLRDALVENYNIIPAVNGRDALDKLEEFRPDLIISDIMMAEVDGLRLKEQLPRDLKHIPFIFITAKTKESDKMEGLALGAVDYIYKPFNIKEMKLKVDRILKSGDELEKAAIQRILDAASREKELFEDKGPTLEERCAQYGLTDREIEVVEALKKSITNKEAADRLFITTETVKSHINKIFRKLDVSSKRELFNRLYPEP